MAEERVRFSVRVTEDIQHLIQDAMVRDNCQTQNELVEKAIRFYASYVATKDSSSFLPPVLVSVLRGTLEDYENRIARLLFKQAVELAMMMNVLATGMEIDEGELRKVRARCIEEVKKSNGRISLTDVVQRGNHS